MQQYQEMKLVQENHTIGYWKGQSSKPKNYYMLANFGLRLLKHVRAPKELPQYSGFMVEVTQRQRCCGVTEDGSMVVKG